jgi:hypothetical protein
MDKDTIESNLEFINASAIILVKQLLRREFPNLVFIFGRMDENTIIYYRTEEESKKIDFKFKFIDVFDKSSRLDPNSETYKILKKYNEGV